MGNTVEAIDTKAPRSSKQKSPPAPGGSGSPQLFGQTPDRSTLPGHHVLQAPARFGPPVRPLTQYGTAEEITNAFPAPEEEADSTAFEQATAAFEEQRKAFPWQMPPKRPMSNFALDQGLAESAPAVASGDELLALTAEATNEA